MELTTQAAEALVPDAYDRAKEVLKLAQSAGADLKHQQYPLTAARCSQTAAQWATVEAAIAGLSTTVTNIITAAEETAEMRRESLR